MNSSASSSETTTTTRRRSSSSSYDDIVFGSLLLASRIQSVCATLMGENVLTENDLEERPNLLSKVGDLKKFISILFIICIPSVLTFN